MIVSVRTKKRSDVGGKPQLFPSRVFGREIFVVARAPQYALLNKIMEMASLLRRFLQVVKK